MINIVEKQNIIPILVTIPMVPSEVYANKAHFEMNKWIRSSGYQYLDIAKILSMNENGITIDE